VVPLLHRDHNRGHTHVDSIAQHAQILVMAQSFDKLSDSCHHMVCAENTRRASLHLEFTGRISHVVRERSGRLPPQLCSCVQLCIAMSASRSSLGSGSGPVFCIGEKTTLLSILSCDGGL
jgi:hypothetical protein